MKTIVDLIGNTPIIKLQNIVPENAADVFIKLEEYNFGGSIKSRIALQMIKDAEIAGILKPHSGQTLIEPTGGNTGTGLAIISILRGYKVILVVPDNYSKEKIKTLTSYGAEVQLSDHTTGNDSHITLAKKIKYQHPEYIWLNQFSNPSNPNAHYNTTGTEICNEFKQIDCFVAGIGSGGTISGVGKKIKENFPKAQIIGVQPKGCDIMNGTAIPHRIQGLAVGMVPPVFDRSIVDEIIDVEDEKAIKCMKELAKKEALLVGTSSGANVCGAIIMAKKIGIGKTVVTVAPDTGKNNLDIF
jgi:cysteine synthase A